MARRRKKKRGNGDDGQRQARPERGVIATAGRRWGMESYVGPVRENPDEILAKHAGSLGLRLYEEMATKDAQIAACLQQRRDGVLACTARVQPASDAPADGRVAEAVTEILDGIRTAIGQKGGWRAAQADLLEAIHLGYAVLEVIWRPEPGRVAIDRLNARPSEWFVFDRDDRLRMLTQNEPIDGEVLPDRKFLVHAFRPQAESPYGRSVLKPCYWPYWLKKNGVKFWALSIERRAAGLAKGRYPRGAPKGDRNALLAAIHALQTETGAIMPDDVDIDFVEFTSHVPIRSYGEFIELMDAYEAKCILGQTLTSSEGQHGTQALGKVHEGVKQELLEKDAQSLAASVDALIEWIVALNFGPGVALPTWQIDYEAPEDLEARAKRDKVLVGEIGVPVPLRYFYETFGLPEPAEGEATIGGTRRPPEGGTDAATFAERRGGMIDRVLAAVMDDASGFYRSLATDAQRWAEAEGKKKAPGSTG